MRGIVYIGIGAEYLNMSIRSARSLQTKEQICIITDAAIDFELSSNISIYKVDGSNDNPEFYSAYLKTQLHKLSPFDETLFLDADILAVDDFSGIWDFISDGISIAPAFYPIRPEVIYPSSEVMYTQSLMQSANNFTQYNAGVFLFRKSQAMFDLFKQWDREWSLYCYAENMALSRILLNSDTKIFTLPSKYNQFYPYQNEQTCLLHYIGRFKQYLPKLQKEQLYFCRFDRASLASDR
jgi:Glycosyl transferase family 8